MFERKEDGAMVAVKEFGSLTAKEWRILSSVRHPHICSLVDRTRYENPRVRCTKLVMEIMDTSLQSYMARGAKRDKLDPALDAFDVKTARQLVLPIALALDYLHHKVLYPGVCLCVCLCVSVCGAIKHRNRANPLSPLIPPHNAVKKSSSCTST